MSVTRTARTARTPGPRAAVDVRLLTMTPRLDGLQRGPAAQSRPAGGRAGGVPGAAPARRHHQRPAAHARARLVRRRRRRRRRCSTPRTRRGAPWASTSKANLSFPPATRHGLYQISPAGDRRRAPCRGTGRRGEGAVRSRRCHRLLRAALELVEGEPLANALSGYSWWEAEGHGGQRRRRARRRRLRHGLARPPMPGSSTLARWGLERAPRRRALQRGAVAVRHAGGGGRGRRRPAPARMARVPAPASTRSIRAARRRRGPSPSTASSAGGRRRCTGPAGAPGATCRLPATERRPPTP